MGSGLEAYSHWREGASCSADCAIEWEPSDVSVPARESEVCGSAILDRFVPAQVISTESPVQTETHQDSDPSRYL